MLKAAYFPSYSEGGVTDDPIKTHISLSVEGGTNPNNPCHRIVLLKVDKQ